MLPQTLPGPSQAARPPRPSPEQRQPSQKPQKQASTNSRRYTKVLGVLRQHEPLRELSREEEDIDAVQPASISIELFTSLHREKSLLRQIFNHFSQQLG